jgi:hypothetical protein
MHAVVSPMFLKRCTTLRGMKTMVEGPASDVRSPTSAHGAFDNEEDFVG